MSKIRCEVKSRVNQCVLSIKIQNKVQIMKENSRQQLKPFATAVWLPGFIPYKKFVSFRLEKLNTGAE